MNKTDRLKYQYPMVQFLYWVSCCACSGFVAIFLQHYGLSNTAIGVVVGGYGVLSLGIQPFNVRLVKRIRGLTVRKLCMFLFVLMIAVFAMITFVSLPAMVVIGAFAFINALNGSVVPLLSSFGMEYVNQKRNVNFGLARGIGSLGWAVSAVYIGLLLENYSPNVLGIVYLISAGVLLLLLICMEDMGGLIEEAAEEESEAQKKDTGIFIKCLSDKTFLFVTVGIFFGITSHALCTTYTINIVEHAGGSEMNVGLAQFFGASSEMIGMVVFGFLIKKYSSIRILKISSIFLAIRFLFLIFANSLPLVMIGYALQGPSAGLYIPATVYFVNERMLPKERTQGQTIFNLLTNSLASFVGNLLGGSMLDLFGLQFTLVTCFLFGVICCVCIMTRKENNCIIERN